jgi:hypothetical protein
MAIVKGMVATFWLELAFCAVVLFMIARAKQGLKLPEIYKVAGLDAMDEAIGRATEMGRPVHYAPGIGGLDNAQTMASFGIMGYVARQCAKYDTSIIVTNRMAVVYPITEEIVRQAYAQEGKSDVFQPENVRFFSEDQFGYATAVVGLMNREKPAANILIGAFWAESLIFAVVGSQIGAIQIAGTAQTSQLPFFVAACDYTLLGEEMYAAGAYLTKDPVLMGNLIAQDWGKMAAAALVLVGALWATAAPKGFILKDWLNL